MTVADSYFELRAWENKITFQTCFRVSDWEREGENCERHNFAVHSSKISLVLVSSSAAAATAAVSDAAIYAVRLCMLSR